MLEIMVAVTIMAGLSAMTWMSINSMFRTRDYVTERYERYQMVRVAFDRMSSELASAYVAGPAHGAEQKFGAGADQNNEEPASAGREEHLQFGMRGEEDRVAFTTLGHTRMVRDERTSHHAEIEYFVAETERDGEYVDSLMRREDTTVDGDITEGGKVYTLLPNIQEVEFEYWDAGEVDLGTEEEMGEGDWKSDWDTTSRQFHDRLPLRVKITVTLPPMHEGGEEETFTTQTEIQTHELLDL